MANKERVILIKGDSTKWYDQAIFIMKKNAPQNKIPIDFVAEAERIINGYGTMAVRQPRYEGAKKKAKGSSHFDLVMNMFMLAGCLLLAGILTYHYFV